MTRFPLFMGLALGACLDPSTPPDEIELHGPGSGPASLFQVERAARIDRCTATKVGPNFILSSAHCVSSDTNVRFYDDASAPNNDQNATIDEVIIPPGVDGTSCEQPTTGAPSPGCFDSSGMFSDIELLRVHNTVSPSVFDSLDAPSATLAWRYPGIGAFGQKVGSGLDTVKSLRQLNDTTDDSVDTDGHFNTSNAQTDSGDSGGPFYVSGQVLGTVYAETLSGTHWENRYTSVPRHLDWLLDKMAYRWRGAPALKDLTYNGSVIETLVTTERVCQYACEHTTSCEAYNYLLSSASCGLYTGVTGTIGSTNTHAALHYGQSSSRNGAVTGYVGGDNVDRAVHISGTGIHDYVLDATNHWKTGTITNQIVGHPAPPVASGSRLSAYRRSDGVNAVVYRSSTNRIIELSLGNDAKWHPGDLGAVIPAAGDPAAYVRADGTNAIVYRGTNNHIMELRLTSASGWVLEDLSVTASVPFAASSDPTAFVRSDGLTSVVFRSGAQIFELFKASGHPWDWGQPSALTIDGAAPAASSRPFGYTHRDGTNAIVYRSGSRIIELYATSAGWRHGDITDTGAAAQGDPVAYVRADGVNSVVYRTTAKKLVELTQSGTAFWQAWTLSQTAGADNSFSDPSAYIRRGGIDAVLSSLDANHSGELSIHIGDGNWFPGDLTGSSLETP